MLVYSMMAQGLLNVQSLMLPYIEFEEGVVNVEKLEHYFLDSRKLGISQHNLCKVYTFLFGLLYEHVKQIWELLSLGVGKEGN